MTINGTNYPKIRPGSGFRDSLLAPLTLTDFIENDSALEDGTRVIIPQNPKKKARELTLEFQVVGDTTSEFETLKSALYAEFYTGTFVISNLGFTSETFRLVYTGKSPAYGMGLSGRACRVSASFREYDPTDR